MCSVHVQWWEASREIVDVTERAWLVELKALPCSREQGLFFFVLERVLCVAIDVDLLDPV